jgi:hypothetical protein
MNAWSSRCALFIRASLPTLRHLPLFLLSLRLPFILLPLFLLPFSFLITAFLSFFSTPHSSFPFSLACILIFIVFLVLQSDSSSDLFYSIKTSGRTPWMGDQPITSPLPSVQQFLLGATAPFEHWSRLL